MSALDVALSLFPWLPRTMGVQDFLWNLCPEATIHIAVRFIRSIHWVSRSAECLKGVRKLLCMVLSESALLILTQVEVLLGRGQRDFW